MAYRGPERRSRPWPEQVVEQTLKQTGQYRNGGTFHRFWREWGQTLISILAILGAILLAWKDTEQERAVVLNELANIRNRIERLDNRVDQLFFNNRQP